MEKQIEETEIDTPFDGLLKNLADHFAPELVAYLADIAGVTSCESIGGEVELVHRLTDRVWRLKQEREGKSIPSLFHLEFESAYNSHMGRRLGAYGWSLFEKYELPVQHLVWYVGERRPSFWPENTWYRERTYNMELDGTILSQTRWREVWLPGGFKAEEFIKEAPAYLLPFAAMMDGANKVLIGKLQDAILKTELSEGEKQELLVMLVFFASRSLSFTTVMEVINMGVLEHNNPFAQYLIEKGRKKGREEGREEGLQLAQKKLVAKLAKAGQSPLQIADLLEITEEEVNKLLDEATSETV